MRDWAVLCAQYHQIHATAKEAGSLGWWCEQMGVHRVTMSKKYLAWKRKRGLQ